MQQKITEIPVTRNRTYHYRDAFGNLVKDVEEIEIMRPVKTVSGGKKFANFFVDYIIIIVINSVVNIPLYFIFIDDNMNFGQIAKVNLFISLFNLLCYPLYYFFTENILQRSLAKYLTRCRVIDVYCEKPDWKSIMLRSIVRLVPFEMFSCLGDNGRGWHDRWSNTYVVSDEEYYELKSLLHQDPFADKTDILG